MSNKTLICWTSNEGKPAENYAPQSALDFRQAAYDALEITELRNHNGYLRDLLDMASDAINQNEQKLDELVNGAHLGAQGEEN